MTRLDLLSEIARMLELPENTLNGSERLEDLAEWNSIAAISFIALIDSIDGSRISAVQIAECETVADLLRLAGVEESKR